MKKIITMILIVSTAFSTCFVSTYADTDVMNYDVTKVNQIEKILENKDVEYTSKELSVLKNDFLLLESLGTISDGVLVDICLDDGTAKSNIEYVIDYGEQTESIQVLENSDAKVILRCSNNLNTNIVELCSSGKIYLDGKEVEYTVPEVVIEPETVSASEVEIIANENSTWFTQTCPYGSAADYSNYVRTTQCANIALKNKIMNITKAAFLSIVTAALGVGAVASVCMGIAYDIILETQPETEALSQKCKIYTHKSYTNGYVSPKNMTIYKHVYLWYPRTNFLGAYQVNTAYQCTQIY